MTRTSTGKPKQPAQRDFDWDALLASAENGTIDLTCESQASSYAQPLTGSGTSRTGSKPSPRNKISKEPHRTSKHKPSLPNQKRKRAPTPPEQPDQQHQPSGNASPRKARQGTAASAPPITASTRGNTNARKVATSSTASRIAKKRTPATVRPRNANKPTPGNHLVDALRFFHQTGELPHHIFKNRDEGFRKIFQIHTRSNLHYTTL